MTHFQYALNKWNLSLIHCRVTGGSSKIRQPTCFFGRSGETYLTFPVSRWGKLYTLLYFHLFSLYVSSCTSIEHRVTTDRHKRLSSSHLVLLWSIHIWVYVQCILCTSSPQTWSVFVFRGDIFFFQSLIRIFLASLELWFCLIYQPQNEQQTFSSSAYYRHPYIFTFIHTFIHTFDVFCVVLGFIYVWEFWCIHNFVMWPPITFLVAGGTNNFRYCHNPQ